MLGYVRSVLDLTAKTSDCVVCVKYVSLFKKIAKHLGNVAAVWGDQLVEFFLGAQTDAQKGDVCDRLLRKVVALDLLLVGVWTTYRKVSFDCFNLVKMKI
jgi:hypothetical protein